MTKKKPTTEQLEWSTEKRKVADLIHFEGNPRKITPDAMAKLKDRIQKRGFHDVIKIDLDGVILSGNMRKDALEQLGVIEVDVKVPNRKLTEDEAKTIVLESNRTDGEWDQDLLPDFGDIALLEAGFDSVSVDELLRNEEDSEDEFDAEEEVAKIVEAKAQVGDAYELGEHRLYCGDSTKEDALVSLMGDDRADMVFTDPPYNMNIEGKQGKILNDNMSEEAFVQFSVDFLARMKEASKEGAPFYICSGYSSYIPFVYAMKVNGLKFANPIIWVKNTLGLGMNDYRHSHEMMLKATAPAKTKHKKAAQPILYGWNNGEHYFKDVHNEGDVWQLDRRATNTMVHPTQKPIALITKAIKNSSKRGDLVLDLFGGSGSTLIGAEKTGRRAYVMELDPKYVDAIIKRWEKLTGLKAKKV